MTEEERRARRRIVLSKVRRKKELYCHIVICAVVILVVCGVILLAFRMIRGRYGKETAGNAKDITATKYIADRPELDVQLLPVNMYSRSGKTLEQVNGIVVHYTANPGSTAQQNRDYFAGLAESHTTSASSHFVIGLDGEIIQCVPCGEIAYASNERNEDTIAIECCIEDDTGKFNDKTYESLVKLVTWLIGRYDLGVDDVIRHYDVTGKNCPKYYVEKPEAWEQFKCDLVEYIVKYGIAKES